MIKHSKMYKEERQKNEKEKKATEKQDCGALA
jgi:hypothetical protein